MESLPLVNLTEKSLVLEDGVAQDPKQQKEVDAEIDGHVPVTKISKKLLRENELANRKRQLILKNEELRERMTKQRASFAKIKEDVSKCVKEYEVDRVMLENSYKNLEDGIDGHVPVTKISKKLLRENELANRKRQLILKNEELRERMTKQRASFAKMKEDVSKYVKEYEVERLKLEISYKNLEDGITETTRLLNSRENLKK